MFRIWIYLKQMMLLVMMFFLLGNTQALAASPCSLRVFILDHLNKPVPNINVELCRIAGFENGTFSILPEYSNLDISIEDIYGTQDPDIAEKTYQYIQDKELSGTIEQTAFDGIVNFTVEEGIYLVFERGSQKVAFHPYFVSLPTQINGDMQYHVTSTPKANETDIRTLFVAKLWDDNQNAAGKRPSSIDVTVFRDGIPVRMVTLNQSNNWKHTFFMLPSSGIYTVKESSVSDYEPEYFPVYKGYIIQNKYIGNPKEDNPDPEKGHVVVQKHWDDAQDKAGKRPKSITVQLLKNSTVIQTAVLSEANGWQYTFTGLDQTGHYTVLEIPVQDYCASYQGTAATGITIVNRYRQGSADPGTPPKPDVPIPPKKSISVHKIWEDQDNAENKRPSSITVYLIANSSIVKTLELNESNGWKEVVSDLPSDLRYTIWEKPVEGYSTAYETTSSTAFSIINTYTGSTEPGQPSDPAIPPEEPESPDIPSSDPVVPSIPQTGAKLFPVYLLMTSGILLIILGIVDIRNGREKR